MGSSRRVVLLNILASANLFSQWPQPPQPAEQLPDPNPEDNTKLPNGKSQRDAIAKANHEQALKDTDDLIAVAEQLRKELTKSGDFVVSMSSVKKTEQIERLAKRIRGRLKD